MALVIERRYGRETLVDCMTNPRLLLTTYNAAATELDRSGTSSPRLWSVQLIERL